MVSKRIHPPNTARFTPFSYKFHKHEKNAEDNHSTMTRSAPSTGERSHYTIQNRSFKRDFHSQQNPADSKALVIRIFAHERRIRPGARFRIASAGKSIFKRICRQKTAIIFTGSCAQHPA